MESKYSHGRTNATEILKYTEYSCNIYRFTLENQPYSSALFIIYNNKNNVRPSYDRSVTRYIDEQDYNDKIIINDKTYIIKLFDEHFNIQVFDNIPILFYGGGSISTGGNDYFNCSELEFLLNFAKLKEADNLLNEIDSLLKNE